MWELDCKESWVPKNWCFWTVVLEKTLESPLDCKEIQPVNLKGNQSWIFTGRTDAKAETPILWPLDVKSRLIGKDPDAGKDWSQEEKGLKDGWMASPTWGTWVWASSGSWWWTGKPGMIQSVGSQRVGHSWATELNWSYGMDYTGLYWSLATGLIAKWKEEEGRNSTAKASQLRWFLISKMLKMEPKICESTK